MAELDSRGRSVLFTGGRTGGHIFPALAVAEELLGRGWRVGFAGTAGGMEARLVGELELPFFPLSAAPLVGSGPLARLRALLTLMRSAAGGFALVRRISASHVFGTGGYVSAPAALGGWLARRWLFLLEPNAEAGLANRMLSRLAHGAAVAFESTRSQLHCPSWVTGVPVRSQFFDIPPRSLDEPPSLLVVGGSQGAERFNREVPRAIGHLSTPVPRLRVLHQAGAGHRMATEERYRQLLDRGLLATLELEVVDFVDDMAAAMAESDLVLSRAGAITLAELCAAGRGALLVPLELAGAHQRQNAAALEAAGAALVLTEAELGGERLGRELESLFASRERLSEMGRQARSLARRDATRAIADRLEALEHDRQGVAA